MEWKGKYRKTRVVCNVPGNAHELTWTCFHNRPFFNADRCSNWFLLALERSRRKYAYHLWAYVIMPTHVHVLLWPGNQDYAMEAIAASIKQSLAKRAVNYLKRSNQAGLEQLATHQRDGAYRFWQDGGGYDRNLISTKAIHASLHYIHNNPVRKGLVPSPEEWAWSSAREWLEPGSGHLRIDMDSFPRL
jgi:putative transposase